MDRPSPARISSFAAMAVAAFAAAAKDPRMSIDSAFPYLGGGGHASHWQGHQGEMKTARRRAKNKVAHASRVRNRPKKAKKWSGKVTLKTKLRARRWNRLALFEARTETSGIVGGVVVQAP